MLLNSGSKRKASPEAPSPSRRKVRKVKKTAVKPRPPRVGEAGPSASQAPARPKPKAKKVQPTRIDSDSQGGSDRGGEAESVEVPDEVVQSVLFS